MYNKIREERSFPGAGKLMVGRRKDMEINDMWAALAVQQEARDQKH
jgi:hypothetical protein